MTRRTRTIVIDPVKCVGCGDCSRICPVKVYTGWWELSEDSRKEMAKLSTEERHIRFSDHESGAPAKKARQLADKIFAYIDVESCVDCRQCSDACWKEAITVISQ